MPRWESSPVDVQCAHTKRVTPSRPVPDPAGPAVAELVTGTGTDNMITDATAASSSVLVTDSHCMRATCTVFSFARASLRYMLGCTRHMPSHPLQKRSRTLQGCARARFEMPKERAAPASKSGKGGQLTIAARMTDKVKAGSEALKVKEVAAKDKGKKKADDSSEGSELEESEGAISSADSSLPDPECSQLKTKRTEGKKTKRRTKPATPLVEVTFHF
jgi:hypothetical protein